MAELTSNQRRSLHVLAYMLFRMGQEARARKIYAGLAALAFGISPTARLSPGWRP